MITLDFNGSEPVNWLIAAILVAMPIVQFWLISRNTTLTVGRKRLRLLLNGLLWLVLVGYVLQIHWKTTSVATHVLVAADDVPASYVRQLKDSLGVSRSFTVADLKESRFDAGKFDSVTVVGQAIEPPVLSQLAGPVLQWIPYYAPDQMQTIGWKGVVWKGELQKVVGGIQSSRKQILKINYAGQTLDSLELHEGFNAFALQFPAFSQGRTATELVLGGKTIDTVRFFTRATRPLSYQFVLDNPDFESKTLADWLGQKGNSVQLTTTVSKDVSNSLAINQARGTSKKLNPDILITDPANAANPLIKKAVADGKSVLFINFTNPETETRVINQALSSNWKVRKVSNETSIAVGKDLNALPYRLANPVNQIAVAHYPVAVQKNVGKIGVSLLSETYPLKLSGDSVAYERSWNTILAQLQPSFKNNIQVEAPLVKGERGVIRFNAFSAKPARVRIGRDFAEVTHSPINDLSADVPYLFSQTGWQSVQDSVEVYVSEPGSTLIKSRLVSQYIQAHSKYQTLAGAVRQQAGPDGRTARTLESRLPDWVWLLAFLLCFTALWVEPKFV